MIWKPHYLILFRNISGNFNRFPDTSYLILCPALAAVLTFPATKGFITAFQRKCQWNKWVMTFSTLPHLQVGQTKAYKAVLETRFFSPYSFPACISYMLYSYYELKYFCACPHTEASCLRSPWPSCLRCETFLFDVNQLNDGETSDVEPIDNLHLTLCGSEMPSSSSSLAPELSRVSGQADALLAFSKPLPSGGFFINAETSTSTVSLNDPRCNRLWNKVSWRRVRSIKFPRGKQDRLLGTEERI